MNIVGELRWFLGDDFAQLKFSESDEAFSIDLVMVPSRRRGRGTGTALVQHVLMLADITDKNVHVTARPVPASSEEKLRRLESYYAKFDFRVIDHGLTATYMLRRPASAPS